jgi:radical SAM superfamily enzyme YgiQ (UPF0313 family)
LKDILLVTPPFTQLNTPYPATAYLKGFLNTKNMDCYQMDLGIEVILKLFSKEGLQAISPKNIEAIEDQNIQKIAYLWEDYINTIDAVIQFLQGNNPTFARQIVNNYLPQAGRFSQLDDLEWAFGNMGIQDQAKHLATLYLEDLSDYIISEVDNHFGFSRYAEKLGRSANSFNDLYLELQKKPTFIDDLSIKILKDKIEEIQPKLICFSVPFPGNLYSAFKNAQMIKKEFPTIKVAKGGGFPNTELRSLKKKRVFEFFDFITLDDGELPIELLYKNLNSNENQEFKRTFLLQNNEVIYINNSKKPDYKQNEVGTPDYSDLHLKKYISVIEMTNPMHSMWSDGRWNKLTMAHGCYWGKCTFCDISLDYIKLYEPVAAKTIVDRIEILIATTQETGFHFVDEAAPPALMREVALEIIKRKLVVTWWANIRFEKNFSEGLCYLLKKSGCIAVTGGLEVASDRLLKLIDKGVTVEQVAQVTQNFTKAGVLVHAYLMYGYPTQTIQETIDSLEMVRQMFKMGILQSGFWHQFALTAHAPIIEEPEKYGIIPLKKEILFANNDVEFTDKTGINHDQFSFGLKKSLYNFMHKIGLDYDLQDWFDFKIPKTKIAPNYIDICLNHKDKFNFNPNSKVYWLGKSPKITEIRKQKKGNTFYQKELHFFNSDSDFKIVLDIEIANWFFKMLTNISINNYKTTTLQNLKNSYEENLEHFELFWFGKQIETLKMNGLVVV